jgi:DNA modification methylase
MPTLEFKGKPFVYSHHLSVPFRELVVDPDKSLSSGDSAPSLDDNLIIHGDNLEALKALLPRYAGNIDVIYIDPPYNTGNEGWAYNDNVNAPAIKSWLGKIVDADDMERHDKWLCMMWPRLKLLKELLTDGGVLLVSINDIEFSNISAMLDEIFPNGRLAVFVWRNTGNTENAEDITTTHEYILAYTPETESVRVRPTIDPNVKEDSKLYRDFAENSVVKNGPKNPPSEITLPVGFPCSVEKFDLPESENAIPIMEAAKEAGYLRREFKKRFSAEYPLRLDRMQAANGRLTAPCRVYSGWSSASKFKAFIANKCKPIDDDGTELRFFVTEKGVPTYRREGRVAHFVSTVLENLGTTEKDSNELERIGIDFDYPKPVDLISYVLSLFADPDAIILDSFAGSGTTAQAVLSLNAKDSGGRRFILIETCEYADSKTAERVRHVIRGDNRSARREVREGLGGSFTYCELGEPMDLERFFAGEGKAPAWEQVARYVAYTATGETLAPAEGEDGFAGHAGTYRLHLLYRPDAKWMRSNAAMLDLTTAERIAAAAKADGGKPVLVFAAGKLMGQRALTEMGLTFCQLPYSVHRILGEGTEAVAGVDAA